MNAVKVIKAVKALSGWRETAFLLALVERNLPNAKLFLESTGRLSEGEAEGEACDLGQLLSQSWQASVYSSNEEDTINILDSIVSLVVEDDTDSFGVIPCNNALLLWEAALLSSLNREKKRAEEGSQYSIDSVTAFIEFTEGEGKSENALIKLFEKHELMQRELAFQGEVATLLRSSERLSKELMLKVREFADDGGYSNLGISLEDA